jgi:hypothetical protein
MSIDPKVKEAIEAAVNEAGQSDGLARKIVRWFEAIAAGNESITDQQSALRHLELLYEETQPSSVELDRLIGELLSEAGENEALDQQEAR